MSDDAPAGHPGRVHPAVCSSSSPTEPRCDAAPVSPTWRWSPTAQCVAVDVRRVRRRTTVRQARRRWRRRGRLLLRGWALRVQVGAELPWWPENRGSYGRSAQPRRLLVTPSTTATELRFGVSCGSQDRANLVQDGVRLPVKNRSGNCRDLKRWRSDNYRVHDPSDGERC
jgi:hypothetical protein